MSITEEGALATLRRVPDEIILAVLGRDVVLFGANTCLCAWALRERFAQFGREDAGDMDISMIDVPYACSHQFGGSKEEWETLYGFAAVTRFTPIVEAAFVRRVDEAALAPVAVGL